MEFKLNDITSDKYLLAIDPGPVESGFVFLSIDKNNKFRILDKNHINNDYIFKIIASKNFLFYHLEVVIETIVTYGVMPQAAINTAIIAGRFYQFSKDISLNATFISRPDVQLNLCGTKRSNSSQTKQVLKNRFGELGTKKNPGRLYELKNNLEKSKIRHLWSALELAITYVDKNIGECL